MRCRASCIQCQYLDGQAQPPMCSYPSIGISLPIPERSEVGKQPVFLWLWSHRMRQFKNYLAYWLRAYFGARLLLRILVGFALTSPSCFDPLIPPQLHPARLTTNQHSAQLIPAQPNPKSHPHLLYPHSNM